MRLRRTPRHEDGAGRSENKADAEQALDMLHPAPGVVLNLLILRSTAASPDT